MRIHFIPTLLAGSLLALAATGCGGESSSFSHEIEPNDDVLHATEVVSDEEITVEGSCSDSNDRDYFKVTAKPGTFTSALKWAAGAFEIAFTPESGLTSTSTVTSAVSPIRIESNVAAAFETQVIFVVDCNPAGNALPLGLGYKIDATVPQ